MLIILTVLFLFLAALVLAILEWMRPKFRFAWLIAASSALLALGAVLVWRFQLPFTFQLPRWRPIDLFVDPLSFTVDTITWPFALGIATLILAVILTAVVRENFPASLPWAATLMLGGLGMLAVLADNPLSLLFAWAAIDLTELVSQLWSVQGVKQSERVVISFATRATGVGVLLWASMVSASTGASLDFHHTTPQAGLYLLVASGLRLGVLPLHLPYASESAIRRGFGSALRLISAASSLILLARIPSASVISPLTPYLLILVTLAAVYGSWMWFRSSDELMGRPYWLIGFASLAMAAALQGNQPGAAAWGCATLLVGTPIFLASSYQTWTNRALLVGVWGISALPLSLTATGWQSSNPFWPVWPFLLVSQGFLMAGYIRHVLRPSSRTNLDQFDMWARNMYQFGIGISLFVILMLGFWGWEYSLKIGAWFIALIAVLLGGGIVWLRPRLRLLTPISTRAHWVRPTGETTWLDWFFRGLWSLYRWLGDLSNAISATLEGNGGIMWTLLFLVLMASLLTQGGNTP